MKLADVLFVLAAGLMVAFPPWTAETRWRDEAGGSLGKWKSDTVSFEGYHFWGYEGKPSGSRLSRADDVDLAGPMPESLDPYIPPRQPKAAIRCEAETTANPMILTAQLVLLFGLRQFVAACVRRAQRSHAPNIYSHTGRSDL